MRLTVVMTSYNEFKTVAKAFQSAKAAERTMGINCVFRGDVHSFC